MEQHAPEPSSAGPAASGSIGSGTADRGDHCGSLAVCSQPAAPLPRPLPAKEGASDGSPHGLWRNDPQRICLASQAQAQELQRHQQRILQSRHQELRQQPQLGPVAFGMGAWQADGTAELLGAVPTWAGTPRAAAGDGFVSSKSEPIAALASR